jgi:Tat protein secretion system quality control protein TatD with DNase activity
VIERHLDEHIEALDEALQTAGDKLVAIGEIGLDLIVRIRSLSASRRSSTRSSAG